MGMFEIHCDELIRALNKRADGIAKQYLDQMMKDHLKLNQTYVFWLQPLIDYELVYDLTLLMHYNRHYGPQKVRVDQITLGY